MLQCVYKMSLSRCFLLDKILVLYTVNRPHFGTEILRFGPFGQSGQQEKKVDLRNSEQLLRVVFAKKV